MSENTSIELQLDNEYLALIREIKTYVSSSRIKAALALNKEVIQMYWRIGQYLVEKNKKTNWGGKLLEQVSKDLSYAFPEMRGFSKTNLKYMRIFALLYPLGIGQQSVDQLPWGHITLLIRLKNEEERGWYLIQSLENGWSRPMLEKQIKTNLFERQGTKQKKVTNFLTHLPAAQSLLAQDLIKNPYNFDCLGLHDEAQEREIENASIQHITKFLLELGKGFAFVGRQVPIEISETRYFLDMLFYHTKLHCYVVVELKATAFKAEHAGQLNFYLNAVDDFFRSPGDKQSIGLLLCKSRDQVLAEYSLRGIDKPIGVSEYWLTKAIPEDLKTSLPTIKEIETKLSLLDQEE